MNYNLQIKKIIPALWGVLFTAILVLGACTSPEKPVALTATLNDALLIETKKAVEQRDEMAVEVLDSLIRQAEIWLEMPLFSVVDKDKLPPSGDKHDYMSLSPYWWPNPDTEDGLPYIRRDGERNPEVYDYPERENTRELGRVVEALGVLYYITGDEKYAQKASEFLKTWFLNPETRMNPNMVFAQVRPGIAQIRGTGIIDARRMIGAFNGAMLIKGSESWSAADEAQLMKWADVFAYWLENSQQGLMEKASTNNHGVWYDVIVLTMYYYAGNNQRALEILDEMTWNRLYAQQADNGSFPRELERTIALHYSTFVLDGFLAAAEIGRKLDFDLWSKVSDSGLSMRTAVDFVMPYYLKMQEWPYLQINPFNYNEGSVLLYRAGLALNEDTYINAARTIGLDLEPDVISLLYYRINQ